MSEYLPSFIVEPVLRQARRFSERIGGDDSSTPGATSSFTLPAVPDFQRFYPTRFWSQSPTLAAVDRSTSIIEPTLHHDDIPEEGTLRSIARNIQLWANQINNLDVEDDVIQEPILPSVERDDTHDVLLTEEPENVNNTDLQEPFPHLQLNQDPASHSLPVLDILRQPQRTSSETSINPAHELSYQSRLVEHTAAQGRSQSDPFAALNAGEATDSLVQNNSRDESPYTRPRDASGALPEDDGMRPLRRKINAVWAGPGTAQDKSRMVHVLMTERYRLTQASVTPTSSAAPTSPSFRPTSPFSLPSIKSEDVTFNLSDADLQRTYAPLDPDDETDEMTGEIPKPDLGCLHYKRNVKMQCAMCEKWYTCRVCHDEKEDHQLPRRATRHMLCMVCNTPQPASQTCRVCHVQAAYYYCSICKLWNNDANKSIYHCEDCGICRLGEGLGKDFFHCKTCCVCMSIAAESTHICIERSTKCDCPICGEYMFESSLPVAFMKCGHSIHESCFKEWCNTSYKCPICSKSICNMETQFRRLDRHIEEQPMPEEYSHNRAYVFCNDCNNRSVVKYHWLGLKCTACDSYNTAQLELLGAESPAIQERADRAQEMGVGEAGMTASQSQTPMEDPISPVSRYSTGHLTPATNSSATVQGSNTSSGTLRSPIAVPRRRDSPFHAPPHSPTRSNRAMSPVIGSYFGTGQRAVSTENRRGSYFSVLSFGTATEENARPQSQRTSASASAMAAVTRRPNSSHLSQSHLSPEIATAAINVPARQSTEANEDEEMDFWGGHSPRSPDADIVELDLEAEEESSSDEDREMGYEEDDGDEEEDDPMDILIGHR